MFGSDSEPPCIWDRVTKKPTKARETEWRKPLTATPQQDCSSLCSTVTPSYNKSFHQVGSTVPGCLKREAPLSVEAKHLLRCLSSSLTGSLCGCGQVFMPISQSLQQAVLKKPLGEHELKFLKHSVVLGVVEVIDHWTVLHFLFRRASCLCS